MKPVQYPLLLVFGFIFALFPAQAQLEQGSAPADRVGSWDFTVPLIYTFESTIDGQSGSKVDLNDDIGFGFGAMYNLSNQLSLGGYFNWNSTGYEAEGPQADGGLRRYTNTLETTTIALNATYFILEGPKTPFITGALGYTFMDTNIQTGPADVSCYTDPWWGYTCNGYIPTRTEDGVSYSLGIGFRFDVSDTASFQLSYNKTWFEISNASGTPDFDSIRLDFIFRSF